MRKKKEKPTNGKYYEVKITIGHDVTGKAIRKSFLSTISKADARKKADEYRINAAAHMIAGAPIEAFETVSGWGKKWLDAYKRGKEDATYSTYERPLRLYIAPFFGDCKLSDVNPMLIHQFYKSLPSGRSESFYHKAYLTLNGLLQSAVDNDLIRRNPHAGISPPSGQPATTKRTYSPDECSKLLSAAWGTRDYLDIILLISWGLRREELLALTWQDIDLVHKTVQINKAVKILKNGAYTVGNTKNRASARALPISDDLVRLLTLYQSIGNVSHTPTGLLWSPNNWSQRYYKPAMGKLCKPLDLPVLNPHELRHTCGTLLYQTTGDIYAVSKYLGHAGIDITARIYVHNDVEALRKAVQVSNSVQLPQNVKPATPTNAGITGFSGCSCQARTDDIMINSHALYRLS